MKKLLFVFPIVALLAAGCNSTQQASVQTPVVQQPAPVPTTTAVNIHGSTQQPTPTPKTAPQVAKTPAPVTTAPAIKSINPTSGPANTTATISGTGFTTSNNSVYLSASSYFGSSNNFGLLIATVRSSNTYTLQFIIPSSIPNGGGDSLINPGTYTLTVVNANGASNHTTFTVTPSMATSCVINSFTASPLTVPTGGTASLSWSTNNCTNIYISDTGLSTFNTQVASSGSMSVSPTAYPQSSTTYTIEAHDATGTGVITNSVTVVVKP